jgi:hypothetical protein
MKDFIANNRKFNAYLYEELEVKMKPDKEVKMKLEKKVQLILAYGILFFSFVAGYNDKVGVMIVSFISFIFIMFINNLDKISEIKATAKGFEAKTREIVERAEITIEQLQKIALVLADTELSLISRSGRWGGFSEAEKEKHKNSILSILKQLEVPANEQEILLSHDWYKCIIHDYAFEILGGSSVPEGLTSDQIREWKELRSGGIENPATPEQIRSFLVKYNCMNPEREELIWDYEYFLQNKMHRRPEIWADHLHWGRLKKRED